MYWGERVYATPGCGKTYVANKYRDVVDGDDLIVEAIHEIAPGFSHGNYDDPREVIFLYFRYIRFNRRLMWRVYNAALDKMDDACDVGDVVLFGTMDLIDSADRIFIAKDIYYVQKGFEQKQHVEQDRADDSDSDVHYIYDYLEDSLQRACRGDL